MPPDRKNGGPGHHTRTTATCKIKPADQQTTQPDQCTAPAEKSALVSEQFALDFDDQAELTTAQKFEQFHAENGHVYTLLVQLARQWKSTTGREKLGVAALYERARWEIAVRTNDPDFRLNNDYRSYYSRMIMIREPDLADLFELRRSAADGWIGRAA